MPDDLEVRLDTIATSERLPSLPAVAVQVLETVERPDLGLGELAGIIGNDAALSAKILGTANSAFFATAAPIETLRGATVVLGLNLVRSLALGFTIVDLWNEDSNGLDHEEFWRRSIRAGVAARSLAARHAPSRQEEAFLAGLLSRLGVLALGTVLKSRYREVYVESRGDYSVLEDLEQVRFRFNHRDVGERLAVSWNFPDSVKASIRHMGTPSEAEKDERLLVRLVAAGDDVAAVFGEASPAALPRYRRRTAEWFDLNDAEANAVLTETDVSSRSLFEQLALSPPAPSELEQGLSQAIEGHALDGFKAALAASRDQFEGLASA